MRILLIALILFGAIAHADVATDNNETSWFMGFGIASLYDCYWNMPSKHHLDMSVPGLLASSKTWETVDYVNSEKCNYVMSKIAIGLITGTAISFLNAQRYQRDPAWSDVVYGGLGGVTSVVIHF